MIRLQRTRSVSQRFLTFFLTGLLSWNALGLMGGDSLAFALDPHGNYTTQDFFPGQDEYALGTWKVVTTQLNCRKQPTLGSAIARTFHQGDPLTVKTSEGSHQNVGYLQLDGQGKPWVRVYQANPDEPGFNVSVFCFVRANRRYIAPVMPTE